MHLARHQGGLPLRLVSIPESMSCCNDGGGEFRRRDPTRQAGMYTIYCDVHSTCLKKRNGATATRGRIVIRHTGPTNGRLALSRLTNAAMMGASAPLLPRAGACLCPPASHCQAMPRRSSADGRPAKRFMPPFRIPRWVAYEEYGTFIDIAEGWGPRVVTGRQKAAWVVLTTAQR